MIQKIKQILESNRNIDGYRIVENKVESSELFFIKKNVDMKRAKAVHHFELTVYKDFEENGKKYKGSSTTNIHPTMSDSEVESAVRDAAFAAQFVKNPYYPLVKAASDYEKMEDSSLLKESMSYWIDEIVKAVYKNDHHEKGKINSCEIFLNKVYTHIVNSEGVDVDAVHYNGMIEFITSWKETGEEVELYKCLTFSEIEPEAISQEVSNTFRICRDRAIASPTPALEKSNVLLTRDAVRSFFSFYYEKSSANAVYENTSTWKIGDSVQGEKVTGDLITITLNPFMKNATGSGSFDGDGLPLKTVTILEDGVLKRYIANTRYAHYLNTVPTGFIDSIEVGSGSKSMEALKQEPHLETAAFSDFTVDALTGDFFGEIRLAWYFDGEKTIPVTGGSISGNIHEVQKELLLSKEREKDDNFEGPAAIKLTNVTIAGIA